MRTLQLAVFSALAMANATPAYAACVGADPSIVSAAVVNVTSANGLNTYRITGQVRNVGRVKQRSNVLQFVGIYGNDIRRDVRSVPPLNPTVFSRSRTTMRGPKPPAPARPA